MRQTGPCFDIDGGPPVVTPTEEQGGQHTDTQGLRGEDLGWILGPAVADIELP